MQTQTGNALFLILIAVALFAALSYAVTQSGRGNANIEREKISLGVARIMSHLAEVQTAVQRMIMTGIPLEELDFYTEQRVNSNGVSVPMKNTRCLSHRCQIYHPEGGGVAYQTFEDLAETSPLPSGFSATWEAPGHTLGLLFRIEGVGTELPEIGYEIRAVKPEICRALNRKLGLPETLPHLPTTASGNQPPIADDIRSKLQGISPRLASASNHPAFVGARTFCTNTGASSAYFIKHVLIPR